MNNRSHAVPACLRCGSASDVEEAELRLGASRQLPAWRCARCGCVQPRVDGELRHRGA